MVSFRLRFQHISLLHGNSQDGPDLSSSHWRPQGQGSRGSPHQLLQTPCRQKRRQINYLNWDHLYSPISALSAISSAPLIRRNFSQPSLCGDQLCSLVSGSLGPECSVIEEYHTLSWLIVTYSLLVITIQPALSALQNWPSGTSLQQYPSLPSRMEALKGDTLLFVVAS